jgi:4-amino-4-deoxy-L-arabinose transferase-like glycosyltransferase
MSRHSTESVTARRSTRKLGGRSGSLTDWRPLVSQPVWARPALFALIVVAGFAYALNATGNLEIYYAAAVRSMSMSWHDFFFASFDPAGTVTVDKLPGALWVQALSVRVFGVHAWALVAPQVVEGIASVVVLYRLVHRLAGQVAGILAAGVLVISPATVALNRGNVPDTLMILLVLLAADATVRAIITERFRSLVWAGVLVGLAFQAKMIEAWLILPALAVAYLLAARGSRRRRGVRLGLAGLVVVVVSLSWMLVVSLWPASSRPYVDGSHDNSIFSQVFVYNGFGRIDQPSPNQLLTKSIGLNLGSTRPGWDRLLTGALGHDTGWLIPIALIALVVCLIATPTSNRLIRGGTALWGTWLVVLLVVFSVSGQVNSYYTAALTPPIAGLIGMALLLAWERRTQPTARVVIAVAVAASGGYAAWLLPASGVGTLAGLRAAEIVLSITALILLLVSARPTARAVISKAAVVLAAVAVLAVPAAASASVVTNAMGPFDTPFEHLSAWKLARTLGAIAHQTKALLPPLERFKGHQPDLMATQTSAIAAPFIYDTGQEILPIGGYTGTLPEPTLTTLKKMISAGDFHLVVQAPAVSDPRLEWIANHCLPLSPAAQSSPGPAGPRFALHYCGPNSFR